MVFLLHNTQGLNIISGILFALLSVSKVQGNALFGSYRKIKPLGVVHGTLSTATSKIGCAKMCSKVDTCTSFAYDKATSFCEMSDKVIAGPGKAIYLSASKNCPVDKGYQLWAYPEMALCLRSDTTKQLEQPEAKDRCNQDGGHLVLIDSDDKQRHVTAAVKQMGVPPGDSIFIDGHDKFGNNVFFNWKDEKMFQSWHDWNDQPYDAEPDGGNENCLISRLSSQFAMDDGFCYKKRSYFMCEIDV